MNFEALDSCRALYVFKVEDFTAWCRSFRPEIQTREYGIKMPACVQISQNDEVGARGVKFCCGFRTQEDGEDGPVNCVPVLKFEEGLLLP
jgi:hypothetical protein